MVKGGEVCVVCMPPFYEIWPVNAWAVRILLECILVLCNFGLLSLKVPMFA